MNYLYPDGTDNVIKFKMQLAENKVSQTTAVWKLHK